MPLPKKDSKALNILLQKNIYNDLATYAGKNGKTKTKVVEEVLSSYFEKEKSKGKKQNS